MMDREILAAGFIAVSGKRYHASDCATSNAPALEPGPCDCDFPSVGPWMPIPYWNAAQHGSEILICDGTILYDAESFPEHRPFDGVAIVQWTRDGWCGGYGSEYDGQYWHEPEWFMPLPATASALDVQVLPGNYYRRELDGVAI